MAKDDNVPSFSSAAEAANIPVTVDRETIVTMGIVTWTNAVATQARNPQTGEMGDGFMAYFHDSKGREFQSFIGNVALVGVLARIQFPFKARLVKKGRTFQFSD